MKALYDFRPSFCPNCGKTIIWKRPYADQDFFVHASHHCPECPLLYQFAQTEHLDHAAAESGGDLAKN